MLYYTFTKIKENQNLHTPVLERIDFFMGDVAIIIQSFSTNMSKQTRLLKSIFQYDLYTRKTVGEHRKWIEHIVPNRLLSKHEKRDVMNLFVVDMRINVFRSDYRFGGSTDEVLETVDQWEHVNYQVFRHRKRRIFFPLFGRPIIAQTCMAMMQKYEHLQDYQNHIMIHDDMKKWAGEDLDGFDKDLLRLKNCSNTR